MTSATRGPGWLPPATCPRRVLEAISRTAATAGTLQRQVELAPGALGFHLRHRAVSAFSRDRARRFPPRLRGGAGQATGRFAEAHELVCGVSARRPSWREARWVAVVVNYRAERWSDVVKLLTPIVNDPELDAAFAHAAKIALGIALARLGMFAPALSYLEEPDGPVAVAAVDGALAKALVAARARRRGKRRREVLQDLYAANPENEQVEQALSDTSFGHRAPPPRTASTARTDPWDPETEPSPGEFVDPGAQERKARAAGRGRTRAGRVHRPGQGQGPGCAAQERGGDGTGAQSSAGWRWRSAPTTWCSPGRPGTGKTTIARVVAKIYCGLGLLKKENIKEVHRADLIGQHIGETEAKTNAIIDSALDGVLFLDEAYALVATGAKNDFGLVAIDTLLARMENDRDRLVVIIAGYRADLDRFLDTNQGLRSRFTRSIDFPSYKPAELIEIAELHGRQARQRLRPGCARRSRGVVRAPGQHLETRCGRVWNVAAWTSPATAGSSATSSKSPKRNANSGWTTPNTPKPANSPTRN